jgi:hypothetical protein
MASVENRDDFMEEDDVLVATGSLRIFDMEALVTFGPKKESRSSDGKKHDRTVSGDEQTALRYMLWKCCHATFQHDCTGAGGSFIPW